MQWKQLCRVENRYDEIVHLISHWTPTNEISVEIVVRCYCESTLKYWSKLQVINIYGQAFSLLLFQMVYWKIISCGPVFVKG